MKGFNDSVNSMNRQAANIGNVAKLRQETLASSRAYLQAKQKAEQLAAALGKNGKPTRRMVADYERTRSRSSVPCPCCGLSRRRSSRF